MAVSQPHMISHSIPLFELSNYENNVVLIDVKEAKSDPIFKVYLEIKNRQLYIFQKTSEIEWKPIDDGVVPYWEANKDRLLISLNEKSDALNGYDQILLDLDLDSTSFINTLCDFKPFTLVPDNESIAHLMFPAQLYLLFASSLAPEQDFGQTKVKILYLDQLPYHLAIKKEKSKISSVILKRDSESLLLFNAIDQKDQIVFALSNFEILESRDVNFSMHYQHQEDFRQKVQQLLSFHVYELYTSNLLFHTFEDVLVTSSLWLNHHLNEPERFNTTNLLNFQDDHEELIIGGEKYIDLSNPQSYFVLKTNFYMIFKRQPIDFLLNDDEEMMPALVNY